MRPIIILRECRLRELRGQAWFLAGHHATGRIDGDSDGRLGVTGTVVQSVPQLCGRKRVQLDDTD